MVRNIDAVWEHCPKFGQYDTKCNYCGKEIKGGGISRLKQHLGLYGPNTSWCEKAPRDVQVYFKKFVTSTNDKALQKDQRKNEVNNRMSENAQLNYDEDEIKNLEVDDFYAPDENNEYRQAVRQSREEHNVRQWKEEQQFRQIRDFGGSSRERREQSRISTGEFMVKKCYKCPEGRPDPYIVDEIDVEQMVLERAYVAENEHGPILRTQTHSVVDVDLDPTQEPDDTIGDDRNDDDDDDGGMGGSYNTGNSGSNLGNTSRGNIVKRGYMSSQEATGNPGSNLGNTSQGNIVKRGYLSSQEAYIPFIEEANFNHATQDSNHSSRQRSTNWGNRRG
ncbi:hypothetical protein GIB67_027215 [Kingdonia uniflora]|uniref:BED-type domain-containing protein n=1 Tax=Kingdonia uniflora TaxID=39325 RepID=A0A7J7KYA0_9MAGN|nr:hypothetical protein GIB67_027215 [Kingdonia uniflora]